MKNYLMGLAIFGTVLLTGCISRTSPARTPIISPSPGYPNAPEPQGPHIGGMISGLPIGTSATITATLSSPDRGIIGRRGDGAWDMEVPYKEGARRIVVAHAVNMRVEPAEYVIYFKNGKAYRVINGVETDHEATDLDFKFYFY